MLQVEVIRPNELSDADRVAWSLFAQSTPAFRNPLLSPEFALAVAEIRDDTALLVVRRAGQAVGFLPHHRRPGGLARPVGAPWSDYQALVGEPGLAVDGIAALREAGLAAFRFNGLIDPFGVFADASAERRDAYVIAPEQGGDAYWETLRAASPKRFKNMRRLEHKLAREQGEVSLCAPDTDEVALHALIGWKRDQLRRSGLHDVLHPAWTRALMTNLFRRREGELRGMLLTLRVGGRPVAGHFGVRLGAHYHPWIAAFDPEFGSYSPGLALMSEAIRAMPALGLGSYDLSAGSDHYKKPFASERIEVLEGTARARPMLELVPRSGPLRRMQRRFDHIAATELSLAGRMQGLAVALASTRRRLSTHDAED